jgi:hypothetical protein
VTVSGVFGRAFQLAFYPVCRSYARHFVKDRPADWILRSMCRLAFLTVYHYWPHLKTPRFFAERLWDRMLHDRNPAFTLVSDKFRVRDLVARTVGAGVLIPLLWSGKRPEDIPYDRLPSRFVIKTNHGCAYNILVPDKSRIDRAAVASQLRRWLSENYAEDTYLGIAWGYRNVEPRILIEEFLTDDGNPPADYKFYCFAGRAEVITIHLDRYGEKKSIAVDREFVRFRFRPSFRQFPLDVPRPPDFEAMLELAERLSVGFNFVRVDLYSVANKVYFGELTPYPVGVSKFVSFDIRDLDRRLGEKWGTNPDWA